MSHRRLLLLTAAALSAPVLAGPAVAQPPWMRGGEAADDRPIVAPAEYARYQLSNIRVEQGVGFPRIAVDYRRVKEGRGGVSLAGKAGSGNSLFSGRFSTWGGGVIEESGTLRLDTTHLHGAGFNPDIELYLVAGDGPTGRDYMVSNAVRLGNPGPATSARGLTAEERAHDLARTPPAAVPAGYEPVTAETPLVAGMPLKVGIDAEWVDAELLAFEEGSGLTVLRTDEFGRPVIRSASREPGWAAVESAVLARAAADASAFSPSLRVQPGGRLPIPDGHAPLPAGRELPPGTPVLVEQRGPARPYWEEAFFRGELGGDELFVRVPGRRDGYDDRTVPRASCVIKERILERSAEPDWAAKFAANLGEEIPVPRIPDGGPPGKLKDYPIEQPIPRGAVPVPMDLVLPPDTEVGVFDWGRWKTYKVIGAGDHDPVCVREQREDGGFDSDFWNKYVVRSQLAIMKDTLAALREDSPPEPADVSPDAPDPEAPSADGGMDGTAKGGADGAASPIEVQDYPITLVVPPGSVRVPDDLPIPAGTMLKACRDGSWVPVRARAAGASGPVPIDWVGYGDDAHAALPRDQLVIQKRIAIPLRRSQDR